MKWTIEAAALRVFDRVPAGQWIHHQLQRRIARSFPIDDSRMARERRYASQHLATMAPGAPSDVRALEFGAGRHLSVAMAMIGAGVTHVTSVDVSRLAQPDLVADAARRLDFDVLGPIAVADDPIEALRDIGVSYEVLPPSSFAGIADGSIDLVFSTSVLEHVPADQLPALLDECRRVLRPGGRLSSIVDYKDHYGYSDSALPSHHFLAVPEAAWFAKYSPAIHFQSRLRHDDLLDLLHRAGFDSEVISLVPPSSDDIEWIQHAELDTPFVGLDPQRVGIREAHIVSTPRSQDA